MSGKAVGMVFDHYIGRGAELLLAVKLADNAHDDGTSSMYQSQTEVCHGW